MPSEVVKKEAEIAVEEKDTLEKISTKTNGSQEPKTVDISGVPEDELSESENKENEEPTVEDTLLLKKRAEELLTEGKRSIIIKDFQAAVDVLSEACSLFGTIYSEMAEECAEPYFNYGWALLELSKNQISPVGLEDKDEEENDEENEVEMDSNNVTNEENKLSVSDVADEVKETDSNVADEVKEKETNVANEVKETESNVADEVKETESNVADEVKETDNVENKSTEKEEKSNDVEEKLPEETSVDDENEVEEQSAEKEDNSVNEGEKPDGEDVGEDDINDLQIAWEMLDLAKVIYKNSATEASKLKLAEVLMKCGEVSIEDEKFDTAIQDMTESLEIRRLLLPEDSRIIAETLFQLGIAQELGGSGERAIELLTEAATVLNQKIKNLESLKDTSEITLAEIDDVKSIIPEIQDKIVDIKERKKAAVNALLAAVGAASAGAASAVTTNGETSSETKQASNIGHLVRKRPKQEETADGAPKKVPKLEESPAAKQ